MKKTILAVTALLFSANAFASSPSAVKLSCAVYKVPAGSTFNISDDSQITFKGVVEPLSGLVVAADGTAKVYNEKDDYSGGTVVVAYEMLNLVTVRTRTAAALGNKGAALVDYTKGFAVVCGVAK